MPNILSYQEWLNESFEYHRELNPKIWQGDAMHEDVRKKLLAIAQDFWSSLKLGVQIIDIPLTGSLANYNWTSASDLDVHIIIDFAQVDSNIELVRKAIDGQRFIWNQRHPVRLKDHDVECYVQHSEEQHTSSGLYSILKDRWLIKPTYDPPQIDEKDVSEKVRTIKSDFYELKRRIPSAQGEDARQLLGYLDRLKRKIQVDRKEGLAKNGEFSVENLVFKQLRNDGTIEEIINSQSKAYSNIYEE